MELQLKKTGYDFYESMAFPPFSSEIMRENIVPDSCTDIARIVETMGNVFISGREVTGDGHFCASGTVDVSVLYIPEKGKGPCTLHFQIPFQCCGEGQGEGQWAFPHIRGQLQSIDTRLLNPRKVLTRANLIFYPEGCTHVTMEVAQDVEGDESIQLLRDSRMSRVLAGVREKEFSVADELPLSPGRMGVEEIVSVRADVRGSDSKLIGNKLVAKGLATVTVLYREDGGRLNTLSHELPFSQILDGSGVSEDWESEAAYDQLNVQCRVGGEAAGDDRHLLTLDLLLRCRVTLWRNEEIGLIADMYSTADELQCQTAELKLRENYQSYTRRQNVRQMLETGVAVKSVVDTQVYCGSARRSDGEQLAAAAWARCLYLDENDMLHCARSDFSVACSMEFPELCRVEGDVQCRGEVIASILPEGVELRFPLDWTVELYQEGRHIYVCGGEKDEETVTDDPIPSLILRKISRDEGLWSVAKQYRTTCRAILEANEIVDEKQLPTDRLLLIPRTK